MTHTGTEATGTTLTVTGNASIANQNGFTQWTDGLGNTGYWGGNGYFQPYYPYTPLPVYVPFVQTVTAPYYCQGECHVWGCEHAAKCKCGKATRKPEPNVCQHCKQAHK